MSADNGIYIAEWIGEDGKPEYRVIEAGAIDNCDYDGSFPKEFIDAQVFNYFHRAEIYNDLELARKEAFRINDEIEFNGWFTEYGICTLTFEYPFPYHLSPETAKQIENDYWLSINRPDCMRA